MLYNLPMDVREVGYNDDESRVRVNLVDANGKSEAVVDENCMRLFRVDQTWYQTTNQHRDLGHRGT